MGKKSGTMHSAANYPTTYADHKTGALDRDTKKGAKDKVNPCFYTFEQKEAHYNMHKWKGKKSEDLALSHLGNCDVPLTHIWVAYIDGARDLFCMICNRFQDLAMLTLVECKIQIIPDEIQNLKKLRHLNLSYNNIDRIMTNLAQLEINSLDLSYNALKNDVFEVIFQMPLLENLNLASNQLDGKMPEGLQRLARLKICHLNSNALRALPDNMHLSTLEYLNVSHNALTMLPPSITYVLNRSRTALTYHQNPWDKELEAVMKRALKHEEELVAYLESGDYKRLYFQKATESHEQNPNEYMYGNIDNMQ